MFITITVISACGGSGDSDTTGTDTGTGTDTDTGTGTDTDVPGNSGTSESLSIGSVSGDSDVVGGIIDYDSDTDWYSVDLIAGYRYAIGLYGAGISPYTLIDPLLEIYDSQGSLVDSGNDVNNDAEDSFLLYRPITSGTYYLSAGTYSDSGVGTYSLVVLLNSTEVPEVPEVPEAPIAPQNLQTTAGDSQVSLSWDGAGFIAEVDTYTIYWNTIGSVTTSDASITVSDVNKFAYTVEHTHTQD